MSITGWDLRSADSEHFQREIGNSRLFWGDTSAKRNFRSFRRIVKIWALIQESQPSRRNSMLNTKIQKKSALFSWTKGGALKRNVAGNLIRLVHHYNLRSTLPIWKRQNLINCMAWCSRMVISSEKATKWDKWWADNSPWNQVPHEFHWTASNQRIISEWTAKLSQEWSVLHFDSNVRRSKKIFQKTYCEASS